MLTQLMAEPTPDPRIPEFTRVTRTMRDGQYDIDLDPGPTDPVGELGEALLTLGNRLEQRWREGEELARITAHINAGFVLDDVLNHVYDAFRDLIPYDRIGCSLIDDQRHVVRAHWARADYPLQRIVRGYSASLQGSSLQTIIDTGQPRIINNLHDYYREHPGSHSTRLILEEGIQSSLTCPLLVLNRPVGFLFFSSRQTDTYSKAHINLYAGIAGQLSVIVEKSRLYQQLLDLNALKSKFLGMAAHDLRNPIGIVRGYLGMLSTEHLGTLTGRQRSVLGQIDRSCQTMLELIDDFLDISAIESGHLDLRLENLDIGDFLRSLYLEQAMLVRTKSIRFSLEIDSHLPAHLCFDRRRIEQVLINLLSNAVKYSLPDTTITLSARPDGDGVRFEVRDEGQGIPASEIDHLFRDFGRTSTRPTAGEKSTGLGLAIVRRLVEAHGGTVGCESQPGIGSSFWFRLPLPTSGH